MTDSHGGTRHDGRPGSGRLAEFALTQIDNPSFTGGIAGTDSGETIQGTPFDDTIEGGGGDDVLFGHGGGDMLFGGIGNDRLVGGDGTDSYHGDDGIDTADFSGEPGRVAANLSNTSLYPAFFPNPPSYPNGPRSLGTNEALDGYGNYEVLSGIENVITGGGADLVNGSDGANRIETGDGGDRVLAMGGNDLVFAGAGNDRVEGGAGDDRDSLFGNAGDDIIEGGTGGDVVEGGAGRDRLNGGAGDDQVRGDDGDDALFGGDGADILRGGSGVDGFDGGSDGDGTGNLGPWGDRVSLHELRATQGAVADLRTGIISNDGFGNVEAMVGIESLGGDTAFVDTFYGNDGVNFLYAGRGDKLFGFGGDDRFDLHAAGSIDGGDGIDLLALLSEGGFLIPDADGDGVAEYEAVPASGWTVDLTAGTLRDGYGGTATVVGIENLFGSRLADTIAGDDRDNEIDGLEGDDTLHGGGGNDILTGGDGVDTLRGGTGNDVYVIDANDIAIELAGEGVEEIRTGAAAYVLGEDFENLRATDDAAHDFRGNGGNNAVTGGGGNDTLRLQDGGDDVATGGGGNDILFFGAALTAADTVDGGSGTDTLVQGTTRR